ncbi:Rne/Rng family ribonuclease [Sphingosinicella soli]|uniref:Ribonuclease E n=1 Tax=Sphingosinicella soli TaxID=333708 RepID=A0A7W7F7G0_9SPHN|nr:Rne/Rng family ribonuclease [Sphingosinicella soli]MBB4633635.1 ribonuclease E [Sphingosinicella soli]
MSMRMLIDARHPEETRVAVIEGNRIEEFDFESAQKEQLKGNIYLAKVTRVEPSLQAAFVEYGGNRHGFLAFSEIHPDYYQIPKEDRDALLREEREAAEEHRAEMDAEHEDDDDDVDSADERSEDGEDSEPPAPTTVGSDHHDDHDNAMRAKRQNLRRRYKIQEVIKRRQVLLVQVVKEERGNKGAALTTYLSLAGRYCVFMPNTNHGGGISRKISNQSDRKRLKSIVSELQLPQGMGCIIRTAGLSRTRAEIRRDFDYLTRLWDEIREKTLASSAPALIHEDSDLIKRAIRDIYNRDIGEVLVDGEEGYRAARSFMKLLMPSHAKKVQQYVDPVPLFQRYQVEQQLAAMYHPVVQLKSGGYMVINPTEALVSIDINSGKSTREHNIEETALKTNLEAAREIARQLRLRDMAGLVVIDFIDMDVHSNNRKVEKALKEALKHDRARIQVGRISSFGLLEMSRQRLRTGVLEASTHVCPVCDGAGMVRTVQSAALGALRVLEAEALRGKHSRITLRLPFEVAIYMLNVKRNQISRIEDLYGVMVEITPNGDLNVGEQEIDGGGPPPTPRVDLQTPVVPVADDDDDDEVVEEEDEEEEVEVSERRDREDEPRDEAGGRSRRRRRGRGGRRDRERDDERAPAPQDAAQGEDADADAEAPEDAAADAEETRDDREDDGSKRRRRRRGRRGGRRRNGEEIAGEAGQDTEAAPEAEPADEEAPADPAPAEEAAAPARKPRGRRKAVKAEPMETAEPEAVEPPAAEADVPEADAKPKRTRRKKADTVNAAPEPELAPELAPESAAPAEVVAVEAPEKPKRAPRRKAAAKSAPAAETVSESVEDAETAEAPAGETGEPGTSPRKGWWQRTFGD